MILLDTTFWGGIRPCIKAAGVCETFGLGVAVHSSGELGIQLATMLHLGAVVPNLGYAADAHYHHLTDDVIAGGKMHYRDGAIACRDGPGLGVTLDRDKLAHYHELYREPGRLSLRSRSRPPRLVSPGAQRRLRRSRAGGPAVARDEVTDMSGARASTRPRLTRAALATLPKSVARPSFDPAALRTGIVHLGIGAFHRGHQAFHTQPLLARDPGWGILGASLRRPDTRDALKPQDWLYTLAERDGSGDRLQVMAALTGILVAPEYPRALVQCLADPAVRIVSLTVTEKGYCRSGSELDESNSGIRHDLSEPDRPTTVLGFLAAGLGARRAAGVPPFTVLCCDNLPANGKTVHRLLARFGALLDPELGRWIEGEVACPRRMVDRIVPATTDADRAAISQRSASRTPGRWWPSPSANGSSRIVSPSAVRPGRPVAPPWCETCGPTRT